MIICGWSLNKNNVLFVPAPSQAEKKGVLLLGSQLLILLNIETGSLDNIYHHIHHRYALITDSSKTSDLAADI